MKVGIRERMSDYIVSENSWPLFLYEGYKINGDNLKQGLFMSKILVQVGHAWPSLKVILIAMMPGF
jgi:hypothetical protein